MKKKKKRIKNNIFQEEYHTLILADVYFLSTVSVECFFLHLNMMTHIPCMDMFSLLYAYACFFKVAICKNADPHISQVYGFSPVCIVMCCMQKF